MTDIERRFMFEHHYNKYLVVHIANLIFHILFNETVVMLFVFFFGKLLNEYGTQGIKIILLIGIVACPLVIGCISFMSVLDYANEILMLYEGKIIFETGIIKKKTRLFYEIETADTNSCRHQKKRKHHTMITKRFAIKPHDCESIFQIGDKVTVVYAATRLLQTGGFSSWRTNAIPTTYTIYAFNEDPPSNVFVKKQLISTKQCKTIFWIFAAGMAVLLVTAICMILL